MVFGVDIFLLYDSVYFKNCCDVFQKKKRKNEKGMSVQLAAYYIRIHSILLIISIRLFYFLFHDSIYRISKIVVKEKKEKKGM